MLSKSPCRSSAHELTFDVVTAPENEVKIVEFGRWLQDARQRGGYPSQKHFAGLLGVTATHLSRIETGTSGIGRDTLDKAIELLKLDPLDAYKKAGMLPSETISALPALKNTAATYAAEYEQLTPEKQAEHDATLRLLIEDAIRSKQSK